MTNHLPHNPKKRVLHKKYVVEGLSIKQIAKTLNELKVPTKNKGKKWHPQMIKRILNI